jgi:DNA-binding MarR family transcriptional regulator/predicted GNAT family acetyltransferase
MSPVNQIRHFNRFYTNTFGLLNENLLESAFTLTETRVMFEIAHGKGGATASEICNFLALDPGYLSRILSHFQRDGLIRKHPSPEDKRQQRLSLTATGTEVFKSLDQAATTQVSNLIDGLPPAQLQELTTGMQRMRELLSPPAETDEIVLRDLVVGDLGWVTHRQAILYLDAFRWDGTYEALIAKILGEFAMSHDPARERAWIADGAGAVLGSVFLVRESDAVAKLRLLYVEPCARGKGVGGRLVAACVNFARSAGYRKMTLWTQSILEPARRIYASQGFRCVASETHHSFGHDLIGENWELDLQAGR